MKKLYFAENHEYGCCYTKEFWLDYMKDNQLFEIKLFEAKIERDTGYFFCKEYLEVGEVGNCGKICEKYSPKNGKNGICKHYGNVYEKTEKSIIVNTK